MNDRIGLLAVYQLATNWRRAHEPRHQLFQAALAVDAFRILGGTALLYEAVKDARRTRQLLQYVVVKGNVSDSDFSFPALLAHQLSWLDASFFFYARAGLAALILIGLASRWSALALSIVSTVTYYRMGPFVTFNDYLSEALALSLIGMPIGRTLCLGAMGEWRCWKFERGSVLGTAAFVVIALCLFVQRVVVESTWARPGAWGLVLIIIVTPFVGRTGRLLCSLAVVSLCVDKGRTCQGVIGPCVLLGICILIVSIKREELERGERLVAAADGRAMFGACVALLLCIQTVVVGGKNVRLNVSSQRLLANIGLPWSWQMTLPEEFSDVLDAGFAGGNDRALAPVHMDPANGRLQGALHELSRPSASLSRARAALVRSFVAKRCQSTPTEETTGRQWIMSVLKNGGPLRQVASFVCDEHGGREHVMLLLGGT